MRMSSKQSLHVPLSRFPARRILRVQFYCPGWQANYKGGAAGPDQGVPKSPRCRCRAQLGQGLLLRGRHAGGDRYSAHRAHKYERTVSLHDQIAAEVYPIGLTLVSMFLLLLLITAMQPSHPQRTCRNDYACCVQECAPRQILVQGRSTCKGAAHTGG